MADFLIDDMAAHLVASKNIDYRNRVRLRFRVLATFLHENGLATSPLLDLPTVDADNFKIMRSDLTDDGFAVIRAAYDKWLKGHDKGKPIDDLTQLQNALDKIRKKPLA